MLDKYRLVEPGTLSLADLLRLGARPREAGVRESDAFERRLAAWLVEASVEEIADIRDVGPKRAQLIQAAVELGRRAAAASDVGAETITNPSDVAALVAGELRTLKQECFYVVLLNTRSEILGVRRVFVGTLDSAPAHPREVFRPAIKMAAKVVILVHNHPSGDPDPSAEDLELTERMVRAGKVVGIRVIDHVIVGRDGYRSLKEMGRM